jgi:copper chaperone CopZ
MKAKQVGILSALLATTCCIGPLLLIAIGLGSGAAFVGRYHWLFLIGGIAVLTWAWVKYLREKTACDREQQSMQGRRSGTFTLLIATVIVLGFGSLNINRYVFATAPASAQTQTQMAKGLNRVVIPVEGMSCVTCEIAVRHAVKRVDGVKSAHVSVVTKTATVDYGPAKTSPEKLVAAINFTGYRASLPGKLDGFKPSSSPHKMNDFASMAKNMNNNTKTNLALASAGKDAATTPADRISLFKVSLECPAAPKIGCGSASKPILLDLERQPGVLEAWLNRARTTIAVVWKPESNAEVRHNVVTELKEDRATEMEGASRDEALRDFSSSKGWYRGADVDRLSEEEAGIIAARLVRRVEAKTALAKDKAESLQRSLTDAIRKQLTGDCSGPDQKQSSIEDVAGEYLNQEQLSIFKAACEKGVRALPDETLIKDEKGGDENGV